MLSWNEKNVKKRAKKESPIVWQADIPIHAISMVVSHNGMAVANGRIFISLKTGKVICLG